MNKKRQQKQEEMQKDLEGSVYMIRKSQKAQEMEEQKVQEQRKAQAEEQHRLLMENYALLEKRRTERERKHAEDRKYCREMEEKFQRDEDRRQREREKKAQTNSLDRGAFLLTSKIFDEKKKSTEEFFDHNLHSTNLLNTTLQNSEKETNQRIENSKASLKREFAIQRKKMAETRDDRGAEINEQRAIMDQVQKQYKEDLERERQEKVKAAATYQKLLDAQLKSMRQRSLDALEETMAPKEKEINAALLRKYGISGRR